MMKFYRILGFMMALAATPLCLKAQNIVIPPALVASPDGKPELQLVERGPFTLASLSNNSTQQIFQAPPCMEGNYYVAIQLYYDLGDFNTQTTWAVDLSVSLLNGTTVMITKPLRLQTSDQTYISTVFYDTPISCNVNYKLRVDSKVLSATPPQSNIYVKILLYKTFDGDFNPQVPLVINATNANERSTVSWTAGNATVVPKAIIAYDLEWVFIEEDESFTGDNVNAFKFKEPARITTAASSYSHSTHYPAGKMWYRIRALGYNPQFPTHRIPGAWVYTTAVPVTNHQPDINWQQQTVYAEDGKYKKVMTYLDGTLRSRQVQTNLSTSGDTTLVGESFYDFEGRKSVDILPVPSGSTSLKFKSSFNTFVSQDNTVTSNTSTMHRKFHYDNDILNNSIIGASGAGLYYSPANNLKVFRKDYLPDAEGYVYSQTQYMNDGTGRVKRQSGVGKVFRMDAAGQDDRTTRNFYGNAASEELIRLFGTNVGEDATHYKKNMTVEPNGQVSISYLDQEDRVIATALAGKNPSNVEPLESYTNLPTDLLTLNLAAKNTIIGGRKQVVQKITNAVPNTTYQFTYNLSGLSADLPVIGCVDCAYNLTISITDPDGRPVNISTPSPIPGNESGSNFSYERRNLKLTDCHTSTTALDVAFPVVFTDQGEYTVVKTLTPVEQTYEQLETIARRDPSVAVRIQDLQNSYPFDTEGCDICTSAPLCPESEALIDQAITEIATLDCENILQQIKDDLRKANPSKEPEQTEIEAHARYCEYTECVRDINSAIFEKEIARIYRWTDAVAKGYVATMANVSLAGATADPYFTNAGAGFGKRGDMQGKLNLITIPGITYDSDRNGTLDKSFTGTISQVTDPGNTSYYIDQYGVQTTTSGYHVLYFDLMKRKAAGMPLDEYNEELNRQRWTLFRMFYLEAKRKIRLENTTCAPVIAALQTTDQLPTTEQDVKNWGAQNPLTPVTGDGNLAGRVSNIVLESLVGNMAFQCNVALAPADTATIKARLKAYFGSKHSNFQRLIDPKDLTTNQHLIAINAILNNLGCSLDSLAQNDVTACRDSIKVNIKRPEDTGNKIVNPLLTPTSSGCGTISGNCFPGWGTGAGAPAVNSSRQLVLKNACSSTGDAAYGTFVRALTPGQMYQLCFKYTIVSGSNARIAFQLSQGTATTQFYGNSQALYENKVVPDDNLSARCVCCTVTTFRPTDVDPVTIYENIHTQGVHSDYLVDRYDSDLGFNSVCLYFTPDEASHYFHIAVTGAPTEVRFEDFSLQVIDTDSRSLFLCTEYDTYTPNWNDVVQRCYAAALNESNTLIAYASDHLIDEEVSKLYAAQQTNCLASSREKFAYAYVPQEYHYTLYYYDQAGTLVQTVPPNGVKPLCGDKVKDFVEGHKENPGHTFLTKYKYNSLQQVVWQQTPDAGESEFWYNKKSQIRLARNAQQYKDGAYSYTRYDAQGRVVEVGEMATSKPKMDLIVQLDDEAFPRPESQLVLSDINRTHYDFAKPDMQSVFGQQYLRNRISWIEALQKGESEATETYYNYDVHGNVKAIVQRIPGLGDKRTDYLYDLLTSRVNYVFYQYGHSDQFIHRYRYDSDNRIISVATSTDGYLWDIDASYRYYLDGLLARTELGQYRVQGLDHFYTLQGWIKGVNVPFANDPGNDGYAGLNSRVGYDVFSFALGYFENDYKPISASRVISDSRDGMWTRAGAVVSSTYKGLYDGNVSWMITDLKKVGQNAKNRSKGMQAMVYKYDQLQRILQSRSLSGYTPASGFDNRTSLPGRYDENYKYDANGNILALQRYDNEIQLKNDFTYTYYRNTNRLRFHVPIETDTSYSAEIITNSRVYRNIDVKGTAYVKPGADATIRAVNNINVDEGFKIDTPEMFHAYVLPDNEGAYMYDAIGNLIVDRNTATRVEWTPYGKVRRVQRDNGVVVSFKYDAGGNRVEKTVTKGNTLYVSQYVRDAAGNVMAIYQNSMPIEFAIYGSNRIGFYKGGRKAAHRSLGLKNYELANHLNNVLSVITDNIRMTSDSTWTDVVNATDYYPFGLPMEGRTFLPEKQGENGNQSGSGMGLKALYTFDGNAQDVSGNGLNGTIKGAVPTTDSQGNAAMAYAFDGASSVTLTGSKEPLSFIQNTGSFTITAFIKLNNLEARSAIVASVISTTHNGFGFMYENIDATNGIHQLRFSSTIGTSGRVNLAKGGQYTINDSEWHHVAVVGDGYTVRFYVDGKADGSPTKLTYYAAGVSSKDIMIGASPAPASNSLVVPMNGAIDEVNIFDRPLTAEEVQNLSNRRPVRESQVGLADGRYRYAFNGKEKDEDGEFGGIHYDYGFRIYNPSLGRFLSVDPLTKSYPWYTPYQFAGNKPIMAVDVDGLEDQQAIDGSIISGPFNISKINNEIVKKQVNNVKQLMLRESYAPRAKNGPILRSDPSKGESAAAYKYERNKAIQEANMKRLEDHFTPLEKAMQFGVDAAGVIEGGYGLYKLAYSAPKFAKTIYSTSKVALLAEEGIDFFAVMRQGFFPGNRGVPLGKERLSEATMRALSDEFQIEFAQVYELGSGLNGRGGNYYLFSGNKNSVSFIKDKFHILINHTHPGGTAKPSTFDVDYLIDIEKLGSPQRSSIILPKDKPAVRFNKTTETSN